MKFIRNRLLAMLTIFTLVIPLLALPVFASDCNQNELAHAETCKNTLLNNAPDINDPARLESIAATNQKIEDYLNSKASICSSSAKTLNVTLYQQETTWYCGPACIQMAVKYITGTKYSQNTIANSIGMPSGVGAYVHQVTSELNYRVGSGSYEHVQTSEYYFSNSLIYSVDKGKPVVCHVDTAELPNYSDDASFGHYVLAIGYNVSFSGSSSSSVCIYNDPHYSSEYYGKYSCTMAEMTAAINANASFYIRGT